MVQCEFGEDTRASGVDYVLCLVEQGGDALVEARRLRGRGGMISWPCVQLTSASRLA